METMDRPVSTDAGLSDVEWLAALAVLTDAPDAAGRPNLTWIVGHRTELLAQRAGGQSLQAFAERLPGGRTT